MVREGRGEVELQEKAEDGEVEGGMEAEVGLGSCPSGECYHKF